MVEIIDEVIDKINENNIDIIGIQESVSYKNNETSYAEIISENTDLKYYSEIVNFFQVG